MATQTIQVKCCIVGGGPSGIMLGFLLARAGIDVVVLEKHADFLRDFRGDTIHPSTLEVIHELGLADEFLKQPHQPVSRLIGWVLDRQITVANFEHLPVRSRFIAFMPQWDFLNFFASQGRRYPGFKLLMQTEVEELIEAEDKIVGVRAKTPEGPLEIRADLVVGADGRRSVVREKAGLIIENLGAPIDVFWMRVSRLPTDPDASFGRFDQGKIIAVIHRGAYWQCGYVIAKGQAEVIRQKGLEAFQASVLKVLPFLQERVKELRSWDDVKLLTVRVDRLKKWYRPGLLCIGDAAHAMSPVGGVGINLAIQDAVAAANILTTPLLRRSLTENDLKKVQDRRALPAAVIQRIQVLVQNTIFASALTEGGWKNVPLPLRIMQRFPILQRLPGRFVGMGIRPEHIQTPAIK
jgi:2-polyprenyl-6-methoxyphenol hydroxylase-like FAD-dependent oxidoreductase